MWSTLLPELHTIIRAHLDIRARVNLKRTSRANYNADPEREFVPGLSEHSRKTLERMRLCLHLNEMERNRMRYHNEAMRDLLDYGWLDLLWRGRLLAPGSSKFECRPALLDTIGACWDMIWENHQGVPCDLYYDHGPTRHWRVKGPGGPYEGKTLPALLDTLGYKQGRLMFSFALLTLNSEEVKKKRRKSCSQCKMQ